MTLLEDAGLTPEARRGLLLLARLAGDDRAGASLSPAPVGSSGFRWLMDKRIDALLDDNPLQPLYDRIWERQRAALLETMTALEQRGIEALTFKGAEFHLRYFPQRALGGMADVDVLVRRRDAETVRDQIHALGFRHGVFDRRAAGFRWLAREDVRRSEANHYELNALVRVESIEVSDEQAAVLAAERILIPIWRRRHGDGWCVAVCVDIHHAVASNVPGDPFFAAAERGTCGVGLSMSVGDLIWFTASRYYAEIGAGEKRSLRDLAYLLASTSDAVDWDRVSRAAADHHLGAALFYPLAFLKRAFGVDVPDAVLEASSPLTTPRRRDWGWQLGVLFDFIEPLPL